MHQLSSPECDDVGGASAVALFGLGISLINGAPALREFFDGFFDGFGRL